MLKAVADRIIVKLDASTQSSLIISDSSVDVRNCGIVQSVGSQVTLVKPGNHIVFHLFDELPLPEEDLVVIREKSVLGVYVDETN